MLTAMTHSLAAALEPGGPSAKTSGMLVPSAVVADRVKLYEGEPKEPYGRSAHDTGMRGPCRPMRAVMAGAAEAARNATDKVRENMARVERPKATRWLGKNREAVMKVNSALVDQGVNAAIFILSRRRCEECRRSDVHPDLNADLAMSGMAAGSASSSSE